MLKALATSLALVLGMVGSPALAQSIEDMSRALVFGPTEATRGALRDVVKLQRRDTIPALILGMRYSGRGALRNDFQNAFTQLTGARADSWFDAMLWQEANPQIKPHPSYRNIKLERLRQIDPQFMRFLGGDLSRPENMRIRLEEITWGGVRVDGIPSLDNPRLISAPQATYMVDNDLVFGVEINGDSRAYPLRIMGWHEMFNDVIGGKPVALAYCTLCGAGVLYDTTLPGRSEPLIFGSSGFLYRSNKLMFDRQTDSLWNQFTGKPVAGALVNSGITLKELPVTITSWTQWRRKHPDTKVLSLETGHRRNYGSGVVYNDYFASPRLMFPSLGGRGGGLAQKDYVFGLRVPGGAKAYPLNAFAGGRAINDRVGFQDVVLVGDEATRTVRAYGSGGRKFTGSGDILNGPDGPWRVEEEALIGPGGQRLPRLPGHISYWFGWQSFVGGQSEFYKG